MKKTVVALLSVVTLGASAQAKNPAENATAKGKMEVYDFDTFRLHVYYTNDALGDASFIIEGKDGLVALEAPLFLDNIAEYNAICGNWRNPSLHELQTTMWVGLNTTTSLWQRVCLRSHKERYTEV